MENCNHIFNNEQFSYTAIPAKDFGLLMIHLVLKMKKGLTLQHLRPKGQIQKELQWMEMALFI